MLTVRVVVVEPMGAASLMALRYVFADEAGNFDFSRGGSRYFILTSITMDTCEVGESLASLRRDLARRGMDLRNGFHAAEDRQAVRDEVFRLISEHDIRIDATIFEKAKTMPHKRPDDLQFYKMAWFYHIKYVMPLIADPKDELFIVGASLTLNKKQQYANEAIAEVLGTTAGSIPFKTASWSAASEMCLQAADYCCWAIQRKWEKNDDRSYVLIRGKIQSEFDIFRWGTKTFY